MLYLVATPIGNLGDLSPRAVEVLSAVDVIYCEDTRHTGLLLNHFNIKKPTRSLHTHNERERTEEVVSVLKDGRDVAYVSDAGMPGVSDPGAMLVAACQREGLPHTVIPGPSAAVIAAVLSGLPAQPFSFFGFLPRESAPRRETLDAIASVRHQVILYESPHRVQATLMDLLERFGDGPAAVLRELTKKFETVVTGTLSELIKRFSEEPKGECVICFVPGQKAEEAAPDLDALLTDLLKTESVKDAAAIAADRLSLPKKQVYRRALELKQ
ncbi:MAG: 16S rRNA (cytidine(1402)-2'-O)-methyltransferase [Clostridia bacterium]|nr:16S rRNA (cytidine(1402)-2'-O)-methyltransferase [Clostridia bacterium]